jgi:hypothetical protein
MINIMIDFSCGDCTSILMFPATLDAQQSAITIKSARLAILSAMPERGDAPPAVDEDWTATRQAMLDRMAEEDISVTQLAVQTGQAEGTIRYLGEDRKAHKSTMALISLALGWKHDHLFNILHGEEEKNTGSPMEIQFARITRQMKEYDALKSAIATLHDSIHEVDERITRLASSQDDPEDSESE